MINIRQLCDLNKKNIECFVLTFFILASHLFKIFFSLLSGDFEAVGKCVCRYWEMKKRVSPGCESAVIAKIMSALKPYVYGMCSAGAGGGGFIYGIMKEPKCHSFIKEILARQEVNIYLYLQLISKDRSYFISHQFSQKFIIFFRYYPFSAVCFFVCPIKPGHTVHHKSLITWLSISFETVKNENEFELLPFLFSSVIWKSYYGKIRK